MSEIDSRYAAGYIAGMEGGKIAAESELSALRDQFAVMEEARDAEMLKVANRDAEIAELRTKLEEAERKLADAQREVKQLKDSYYYLCESQIKLIPGYDRAFSAKDNLARYAATIRREALEEAAKVCEEQVKEPECPERAQYCADAIRAIGGQK